MIIYGILLRFNDGCGVACLTAATNTNCQWKLEHCCFLPTVIGCCPHIKLVAAVFHVALLSMLRVAHLLRWVYLHRSEGKCKAMVTYLRFLGLLLGRNLLQLLPKKVVTAFHHSNLLFGNLLITAIVTPGLHCSLYCCCNLKNMINGFFLHLHQ